MVQTSFGFDSQNCLCAILNNSYRLDLMSTFEKTILEIFSRECNERLPSNAGRVNCAQLGWARVAIPTSDTSWMRTST